MYIKLLANKTAHIQAINDMIPVDEVKSYVYAYRSSWSINHKRSFRSEERKRDHFVDGGRNSMKSEVWLKNWVNKFAAVATESQQLSVPPAEMSATKKPLQNLNQWKDR